MVAGRFIPSQIVDFFLSKITMKHNILKLQVDNSFIYPEARLTGHQ